MVSNEITILMDKITSDQIEFIRDLLFLDNYDAYCFLVSRIPTLHYYYCDYSRRNSIINSSLDGESHLEYFEIQIYHLNPDITSKQLQLFRRAPQSMENEFLGAASLYENENFNIDIFPNFFDLEFTDKFSFLLTLTMYPHYSSRLKYNFTLFTDEELHKIYNLGVNPQFGINASIDNISNSKLTIYYQIAKEHGAKITDTNISKFVENITSYETTIQQYIKYPFLVVDTLVSNGLNPFEPVNTFINTSSNNIILDHIHPSLFYNLNSVSINELHKYYDLCSSLITERNNWSMYNRVFETRREKEIISWLMWSKNITLYFHYLPTELIEIIIKYLLYFDSNYLGSRDDLIVYSTYAENDEFEY